MKYSIIFLSLSFIFLAHSQDQLNLENVIAKVLQSNFDIRLERNNVLAAENENNIGNAGYLPEITLNADQNWSNNNTRQELFSGEVKQANNAKNKSTNAALRVNWTFFDGFRMFATDKRLQLQEDYASISLNAELEMKIYQAAILYYTILQQQKLGEVYQQSLDLSKARYALTELKAKNGALSEIALIQAKLDLMADSSVFLQYQKNLADLKVDLNQLMGQASQADFFLTGSLPKDQPITWEEALTKAKDQNTALLMAKAAIAISEMQRKEVQSFYYPELSVYGQYGFSSSENQIGILNSSRTYGSGFGFSFRWTILDRLSTYTQLKNTDLRIENAKIVEERQNVFIENELRKTFNEYLWAKSNFEMEQQTIFSSEEILKIAQNSFENGAMTALELREFQFSVVEAKSRLLTSELALKAAELNMDLTLGNFKDLLK